MKYLVKTVAGIFAIILVLGGSFFLLEKNNFFQLQEIQLLVDNAPETSLHLKPNLKKLNAALEKYKNQSVWKIDLEKMNSEIAAYPWVARHTIDRRFPNALQIMVEPHEVKLLYLTRGGKLVPVIKDGSLLEAIDAQTVPDIPLLIGENFYNKTELRKKSVAMVDEIPKQGSFSRQTIAEIRFDDKDGFWMTLIKQGIKIKMGEEQIGLKSERVSQVLDYMDANNFQARVIDANLSKKVLVRLRKDP